jgi:hypothetical protein
VQRRPVERRDGRELLWHRTQQGHCSEVPQLKGGAGKGHDKVLLEVRHADHDDRGLFRAVAAQGRRASSSVELRLVLDKVYKCLYMAIMNSLPDVCED